LQGVEKPATQGSAMKSFRTLDLAITFYDQVTMLKASGHLRDQLHRAASSISLNLSEGNAKGSAHDKRNFYHVAYGSLRECQTILRLLNVEEKALLQIADSLGASLYKLINSNIKDSPSWRKA
jgi:four helix bundle protein